MTGLLLKLVGCCLLVFCGGGIGWLYACRKKSVFLQSEAFVRFLQYIRESIRFRTLPGAVVLAMAACQPDFAPFCNEESTTFSRIRPPEYLRAVLGDELEAGFAVLETSTRQTACDTLDHLTELCRRAAEQTRESAHQSIRLYPRLGVCLGLIIAILMA